MAKTAAVLGAGIQGVCVALMLAKHGFRVRLIDKSTEIMNRASLTYEGRIHLGFVYGMDKSFETAQRMIYDALHFAPYFEYLVDRKIHWQTLCSRPTNYLVAMDSMLTPEEVRQHFNRIQKQVEDSLEHPGLNYLGERPDVVFREIAVASYFNHALASHCFATAELSLDQLAIRELFRERLAALPSISIDLGHCVKSIERAGARFDVQCVDRQENSVCIAADKVFNCLWESRPHFDQLLGVENIEPLAIRLKYGLLVRLDDYLRRIESFALIHGPNGNFVSSPQTNTAFFAWYPSCLKGLMEYGPIPEAWDRASDGFVDETLREMLIQDNQRNFARLIPGFREFEVLAVKAGLILGPAGPKGTKDIGERDSTLHKRSEFPIRSADGYYSVSTSKYTSAPRNTLLLEQVLFDTTHWNDSAR